MKKRHLLDLFEDIDPEIVSDSAPTGKKVVPKFPYYKIIASVACCALILGGVIAAIPLFDDILHPGTHSGGPNTGIESESSLETGNSEQPPYNFNDDIICNIDNVKFRGFACVSLECSESIIGDKLGDYSVNINSATGDLLYVGNAEIFEIKGVDGSVMLCYSFTDAGGYCEENKYWYLPNYEVSYDSIADMLSKFGFAKNLIIQSRCSYGDNTREHYYTKYDISDVQREELAEILISESTAVETMDFDCDESVQFTLRGPNLDYEITFSVLDNGYVSVKNFKKYYFEIGVEKAKEMIELVKSGVPTEGYEWIEEESIWGTIDPNEYTPEIEIVSLHKYLEDVGLLNNLYLDSYARYSAMYSQTDSEEISFIMVKNVKQQVLDILYSVDGKYESRKGNVYKSISLKYILGDSSKETIYIDGNGYISIGMGSFYIGEEAVNQIFDIIYKQGNPLGYYWNEKDQRWYKSMGTETETDIETESDLVEESVSEIVSEIPDGTIGSDTQAPEYSITIATDGVKVYSRLQSDDGDDVRFFLITIPSLNNATLEYRKDYKVYLDGECLQDFAATSCNSFFLSDLTGDGYPELCLNVNVGFGMIDDRIVVVDLKAKKTIFTKEDRSVNDYYLSLIDGVLHVTETDYRSREVNRTGVLAYNGSDVTIIWDSEVNENLD